MRHPTKEIFQLMKRHDPQGEAFGDDVIRNWYGARRYVLDHFNKWIAGVMGPRSSQSFRIAVDGCGPLVYSVIRHIALMAHFPNFDDERREHCSTITILYPDDFSIKDLEAEIECLGKEEFLFNLIRYSSYTLIDAEGNSASYTGLPFLDIEFELKARNQHKPIDGEILITAKEIKEYVGNDPLTSFTEDELTAAMLVNQAYSTGVEISNLSSTENDKASRYGMALDCLNSSKRKRARRQWQDCFQRNADGKIDLSPKAITGILSCIFCSDTFDSRLCQIMEIKEEISHKFLIANVHTIRRLIRDNLNQLSKSEHARWNTEKLILGFRPLSREESFADEMSIGKRDAYRRKLKNSYPSPSHIDILCFSDLKRINPEDQKYDYFIMLAIPTILIQKHRARTAISRLLAHII